MNGLTQEEKSIALQYAINGADFMFEPSVELCNKIAKGDLKAQGINRVMTSIILQRKPIRLDSNMVIKYCQGTLDTKNTWLFNNGNIRVVSPRMKEPVKLKPKEDGTKKEENSDE
jgi:hypothetical protein